MIRRSRSFQSRRISVDDPALSLPNFSLNSIAELPEEEARASGSYGVAEDSGPVSLQDELRMCNEHIWVRRKSSMPLHDRARGAFARGASAEAATQTEEDPFAVSTTATAAIKKARTSMVISQVVPNYKDIFREIFSVLARAREDCGSASTTTTTTAAAAAVGWGVT